MNLELCCIICPAYDRNLHFAPGTGIEMVHTCGRCFHAYGMSLSLAGQLWGLLGEGHDAACERSAAGRPFEDGQANEMNFMDYLINEYLCSMVPGGGLLAVGRNVAGPEGGHIGLIVQDRGRFPSVVENPEGGV